MCVCSVSNLINPLPNFLLPFPSPSSAAPSNTGGGRRVSFGPTARLSFSSLGRGMGGTGAGIFGEVRTY
jgi:hypothetical protein